MSIAQQLRQLIEAGTRRIGEIEILTGIEGHPFTLCHHLDAPAAWEHGFAGLQHHDSPEAARELSVYAEDGTYRFAKAQTNLKRGWILTLGNEEHLRQALDFFYPAGVAVFLAQRDGKLHVQNLRDKLNRQTGMYRYAGTISDDGAQKLVQSLCGPAHQCARRILWQLDDATPLDDSPASRYDGIPGEVDKDKAIPLLCREACNHFVAECRKAAKKEFETQPKSD